MSRNLLFKIIVIVNILIVFKWNGVNATSSKKEDAFFAIQALNYCHYSLYKIIKYNDRVVLDQEYNNIINNLNLSKIEDTELIEILKELMDVLTEYKLDEKSKELLEMEYQKNIQADLYSSMKKTNSSVGAGKAVVSVGKAIAMKTAATAALGAKITAASGGTIAPAVIAATSAIVLIQAGTTYRNYKKATQKFKEELDETVWKLNIKAIKRINEINKKFLVTYWKFLRKYKAPDDWRLTIDQLDDYFSVLKQKNGGRKYRNLVRMEREFKIFPPYWYQRALAAQSLGNKEAVLNSFSNYEKSRADVFRKDKIYASMLTLKVVETNYEENLDELKQNLNEIIQHDPKNFRNRLFVAYKLIEYGLLNEAEKHLQANIDNDKVLSISRKTISDIYSLNNNNDKLQELIQDSYHDTLITNQEIMYMIGKTSIEDLFIRLNDPIKNIHITSTKKVFGLDDVVVKLPYKWIQQKPDIMMISLTLNGKSVEPQELIINDKIDVSFVFEKVIDQDKMIKDMQNLALHFTLNTQKGTVYFYFEIKPVTILVDKNVKDKGVELAKNTFKTLFSNEEEEEVDKATTKKQKQKTVLEYSLKVITYLDECLMISPEYEIAKCNNGSSGE